MAGRPQVSTLAAVLDKDLAARVKTAEVDVEPLLTSSYASLMAAELARRLKQVRHHQAGPRGRAATRQPPHTRGRHQGHAP